MQKAGGHSEARARQRQDDRETRLTAIICLIGAIVVALVAMALPISFNPSLFPTDRLLTDEERKQILGKICEGELNFWAEVMRDAAGWLVAPLTVVLGLYLPVLGQSIAKPPAEIREITRVRLASAAQVIAIFSIAFLILSIFEVFGRPEEGPHTIGIAVVCTLIAALGIGLGAFQLGSRAYRAEREQEAINDLKPWLAGLDLRRNTHLGLRRAWIVQVMWALSPLIAGVVFYLLLLIPMFRGFVVPIIRSVTVREAFLSLSFPYSLSIPASIVIGAVIYWLLTERRPIFFVLAGWALVILLFGLEVFLYALMIIFGDLVTKLAGGVGLVLTAGYVLIWVLPATRGRPHSWWMPGTAAVVAARASVASNISAREAELRALRDAR